MFEIVNALSTPEFPSPCGEKVGINLGDQGNWMEKTLWCFRPLAGKR